MLKFCSVEIVFTFMLKSITFEFAALISKIRIKFFMYQQGRLQTFPNNPYFTTANDLISSKRTTSEGLRCKFTL